MNPRILVYARPTYAVKYLRAKILPVENKCWTPPMVPTNRRVEKCTRRRRVGMVTPAGHARIQFITQNQRLRQNYCRRQSRPRPKKKKQSRYVLDGVLVSRKATHTGDLRYPSGTRKVHDNSTSSDCSLGVQKTQHTEYCTKNMGPEQTRPS